MERSIDAHKGAVLSIRWSSDGESQGEDGVLGCCCTAWLVGHRLIQPLLFPFPAGPAATALGTAFATGGEDGTVKVWSRNGMLRSTLAQLDSPVYGVAWSGDCDQVLHCYGSQLAVKSMQASSKQNSWKAHDGVVLKADWSAISGLIVSGGEDCRYKVRSARATPAARLVGCLPRPPAPPQSPLARRSAEKTARLVLLPPWSCSAAPGREETSCDAPPLRACARLPAARCPSPLPPPRRRSGLGQLRPTDVPERAAGAARHVGGVVPVW